MSISPTKQSPFNFSKLMHESAMSTVAYLSVTTIIPGVATGVLAKMSWSYFLGRKPVVFPRITAQCQSIGKNYPRTASVAKGILCAGVAAPLALFSFYSTLLLGSSCRNIALYGYDTTKWPVK